MTVTNTNKPLNLDPNLLKAGYNGVDDTKVAAEMKGAELAPVLFGSNILVTYGISDVEALVAQLKNENADSRLALKLKALGSIAEGLSSQQLASLGKALAIADSVKNLEKAVNDLENANNMSKEELAALALKTESLEKQVKALNEAAKEYNKNIEKLQKEKAALDEKIAKLEAEKNVDNAKEIASLKAELAGVEKSIKTNEDGLAATRKKMDDTAASIAGNEAKVAVLEAKIQANTETIDKNKNEISSLKGQMSACLDSIDENVLKTIADELAKIAPEKADKPRDIKKSEEKMEATDVARIIRDSLDDMAVDILDEIAGRREDMV